MNAEQKNEIFGAVKALDESLIEELYKELTDELADLIKELNNSSNIGAYGAMATISTKISDIASDLKKLQHLPTMLTNPYVMSDPRTILDEITKKYSKKKKTSN